MEPVVGIFPSRAAAAQAGEKLRSDGFPEDRVQLLLLIEGGSEKGLPPMEDAEPPGVGTALGGVVGAATGASAGFGLGALTASFLIPGIGTIAAVGLWAAAVFGVAGAIGGAAAGAAAEGATRSGVPRDELYLYEDALARGKGVVFVLVQNDVEAARARQMLEAADAESLDAARKQWWVGIEELEKASAHGHRWGTEGPAHAIYRRGFVAASASPDAPYETVVAGLGKQLGDVVHQPAFRRGYERGAAAARGRVQQAGTGVGASRRAK